MLTKLRSSKWQQHRAARRVLRTCWDKSSAKVSSKQGRRLVRGKTHFAGTEYSPRTGPGNILYGVGVEGIARKAAFYSNFVARTALYGGSEMRN